MANIMPHGDVPDAVEDFRRCVREVLRIADASCGVEELEPELEHALQILRGSPGLKDRLTAEVVSLLETPAEGVVELVSFVMHELRWSPVEAEIGRLLAYPTGDVSKRRHYEAMLNAFHDSWRDRDLYRRYR
ncbi:hypothetical protein Sgleb_04670 [Streptomyces glebosus]|uniref:Uncharacterized protein n=1 Tax=Streptomyces glebosus TaxID=249580 RepID=A0A640SN47_9ACTN|nr:hypothetical protein [Streptomyces glebosus]GFE12420.1 hypothetical protein Sgleb_04670 [Streptomyces glebosus]GHG82831.1 hypothetical protein GCM10010513_62000 [Streptomyces glebosus]